MVSQRQPGDKELEDEEEEVLPFVLDVLGENVAEQVQAKGPAQDVKAHQDVEMEDECKTPEIPTETAWKLWLWIHPSAVAEADEDVAAVRFCSFCSFQSIQSFFFPPSLPPYMNPCSV